MSPLLRGSPELLRALCAATAEQMRIDARAVEKDYWATEVLRAATTSLNDPGALVFKGGTSLAKAFGLIERFSEDIDVLVITDATGNALRRELRGIADSASRLIGLPHRREREGRGYLNARYPTPTPALTPFLTTGVLLELGSRGGPAPNERRTVEPMVARTAAALDPDALHEFDDLTGFPVTVLAPERTLAEKLAFLHHRAEVRDLAALRRGARHLYDVTMLLRAERVREALPPGRMAELMLDIDARSASAGWPFTPRPERGFGVSSFLSEDEGLGAALEAGFHDLEELVWGELASAARSLEEVRAVAHHL